MRNVLTSKKSDDSLTLITNTYLSEIHAKATKLAFERCENVNLTNYFPNNQQKGKFKAINTKTEDKLKRYEINLILDNHLISLKDQQIKNWTTNTYFDDINKKSTWIPKQLLIEEISSSYISDLIDHKKNTCIKFHQLTPEQEKIQKINARKIEEILTDFKSTKENCEKTSSLSKIEAKKIENKFLNINYFSNPGYSFDCKTYTFLKLDLSNKDLRNLVFLDDSCKEIRFLNISKNKFFKKNTKFRKNIKFKVFTKC